MKWPLLLPKPLASRCSSLVDAGHPGSGSLATVCGRVGACLLRARSSSRPGPEKRTVGVRAGVWFRAMRNHYIKFPMVAQLFHILMADWATGELMFQGLRAISGPVINRAFQGVFGVLRLFRYSAVAR